MPHETPTPKAGKHANLKPLTHVVEFKGETLRRGFWLYAWEIVTPKGECVIYVGRTGDSSSANAQSPFNRMGQHLGNSKHSSALRRHLVEKGIEPEECTYRLVAHGPILEEAPANDMGVHRGRRDYISAMEKQLAQDLEDAGYSVLNEVHSKCKLSDGYKDVRAAFAREFTGL